MKRSAQQRAMLRCCASCEWIFKYESQPTDAQINNRECGCPMCGFASYGARYVYGNKCYEFHRTQQPWKNRRLERHSMRLDDIIRVRNDWKPTPAEQREIDARDRRARRAFYEESMGRP